MRGKLLIILVSFFLPLISFAQNISDYLVLQDIGLYKLDKPEKVFQGEPPIGGPRTYDGSGIIGGADHFSDHKDVTYEVMYIGGGGYPSPTVQVTQHIGGDSDRWLLHEVEDSYRTDETERLGLLTNGAILRRIDGNRVFWVGLAGGSFMWMNKNVVIRIAYRNIQGGKPEPLEVVKVYLEKFPSTIPTTLALDNAHDQQWIKDEMERRLWLCDKWFLQYQMAKVELSESLQAIVKSMNVFLDYRERYYGIKAQDEKIALMGYVDSRNGTAIKSKLSDYRSWWTGNKNKAISLP